MKRLRNILFVPLLAVILAACGFAGNLVPPVEVGDVFGIGTPATPTAIKAPAFHDPAALVHLTPAALGAVDFHANDLTFDDVELPNLYGFSLDALWVTIGLGDTITLEREAVGATYPDAFTLTGVEAFIRVSDSQNVRQPVEYRFKELELAITYERQGECGADDACIYKATATAAELERAMLFNIPESSGNVVKDLITIASEGGTNTARVTARLTADAPNGSLLGLAPTFQISNPSTKVSLGG